MTTDKMPTREQIEETLVQYWSRGVIGQANAVFDLLPQEAVAPSCGFDTEAYAAAHNDGYDTAVAQQLPDHPAAFAAALRAAADRVEQDAFQQTLITKPSPSASPVSVEDIMVPGTTFAERGGDIPKPPAEPVRVEDMAVGTTFTARHADHWKKFEYVGNGYIRPCSLLRPEGRIDLYTVSNVTPPKETP
jgi:hypothetical protein